MNMKLQLREVRAASVTLLAPVAWGTTYVTVTELLPPDRPVLVAAIRVLPAGVVLVSIAAVASRWRPSGTQWLHTAVLAVFNFVAFFPLLIVAVYRLPGGVAASVGGVQPLLVATISTLLGGTRPRRRDLLIAGAAAVGVALVVIQPDASIDPVGVIAALGANLSFSIGVVLTKKFPTPGSRVGATGWQLLLGSAALVPLALAMEGLPAAPSGVNLVGFAYLSLVATGMAFVLWFNGIRRLPTQAPPLLGLAAPITGAVLGWIILNQDLTPLQISGFMITISAIIYGATLGAANRRPSAAQTI
jgi:probable blue pigment (indigoidine) exporter